MKTKDYYKILGITAKSSPNDIKKAYRKRVMECHPDRYPDDQEKENEFKEVNEANEILSDEEKRARYDRGEDPHKDRGFADSSRTEDIFTQYANFFGNQSVDTERVINLQTEGSLSIEDYFTKEWVDIQYQRLKQQGPSMPCPTCQGQGRIVQGDGFRHIVFSCGNCGGTGKFLKVRRETETIRIKLEKGRLFYDFAGKGDTTPDGSVGAVRIKLNFTPSGKFHVDKNTNNLICKTQVTLLEFLRGGDIEIDRFGAKFRLRHDNVNGQAVRSYRLKGKGLMHHQFTSDLIVEVSPILPPIVDENAIKLLMKLCKAPGFSEQSQTL